MGLCSGDAADRGQTRKDADGGEIGDKPPSYQPFIQSLAVGRGRRFGKPQARQCWQPPPVGVRSAFIAWYDALSPLGRYAPKHASEMYEREAGVRISKEGVRLWLADAGYWEVRRKRCNTPLNCVRVAPGANFTGGNRQDAHRPLSLSDEELSFLFCKYYRRKVTKNCDFSYDGKRYVIDNHSEIGGWRHKSGVLVDIYHHPSDTMSVLHCGRRLIVYPASEAPRPPQAVCGRRLNEVADKTLAQGNKKKHIPPPSHPWKAASYRAQMERKARKL